MLDIKFVRENPEKVKEGIKNKGQDPQVVETLLGIDKRKRELLGEIEKLREERNHLGKDLERGKQIKEALKNLEPKWGKLNQEFERLLLTIPNLPSPQAPVGKDESENKEIRSWGEPKKFDFKPQDHLELGKKLDLLDFETGAKVSGSQFYYLKNEGVLLELALVRYALEILIKEGFTPWLTPDLARERFYLGTGYLPRGPEAQTYEIKDADLGLIATAEVALAGIHADEILKEEELPKKYAGFSHCFRVEAGGYGKYSKGLYRVHQFSKVEMYIYCLPQQSEKFHQHLLSLEEKIFQGLEIPYRVVEMCTGDLGAQAARKFDLEAFMPGRGEWGEITSNSNTTDYQARRLNIKYRQKNGETEFVHTLNGTAIAASRALIATLENYQQKDGSILVPEVLQNYTGFEKISLKIA